jgi:hypothetical protein
MDIIQEYNLTQAKVKSLNRCRGKLEVIFFLDITTANGQYLEHSALLFKAGVSRKSRFKFPREEPTLSDWETWEQFWRGYTGHKYKLAISLGKWLHSTHQQWQWFYDTQHQILTKHINGSTVHIYNLSKRSRASRLATTFTQTLKPDNAPIPMQGDPTSVITLSESPVKKLQEGPPLAKAVETHLSFWDHLDSWGGAWMWSDIPRDQSTYMDTSWLATGLSAGTLVWVRDGSYDRKRAKDLCRVGLIILCTQTKLRLTGTFWEHSQSANFYRAELLGLCAMHTLAQATQEYYHLLCWSATSCCDNKKALDMSHFHCRRIKQSAKCADIHRIL